MRTPPIALLPLGAFEQHGPHLPYDTDTIIVQGIVDRLSRYICPSINIDLLPTETVGYSIEHMWHDGSKTLRYDEAIQRWLEIGEKCHHKGLEKLVIVNAHGGNSPLMSIVATELRARYSMLCATTSWRRFGLPKGVINDHDAALDIHAGFIETSMMLALKPETVCMAKAKNFHNQQQQFGQKFHHLRAYGPHSFGWMMHDLNTAGAVGDAASATVEAGIKITNHAASELAKFLNDVAQFDMQTFAKKP